MIVVADSSPLNYLILIDQVQLLPRLFDLIAVPDRVVAELTHPRAPGIVTEFISNPPDWLEIHVVERKIEDPDLVLLHPGEQSAILLAEELRADLMLIDDSAGRRAATQRQIRTAGTLGVLGRASDAGYIRLADAIPRLLSTNFRASPEFISGLLKRETQRPVSKSE